MRIDPETTQWRELFAAAIEDKLKGHETLLIEIRDLVRQQNERVRANELAIAAQPSEGRVRANEVAIASMRTWVVVVGGLSGVGGLVAVILAWVMK